MSAILPFLEQTPEQRKERTDVLNGIAEGIAELHGVSAYDLRGFGEDYEAAKAEKKPKKKPTIDDDGKEVEALVKPHTELTRLLWARSLIANALVGAKFRLIKKDADVAVQVIPADPKLLGPKGNLRRDLIPWHFNSSEMRLFSLFSTNSKMRCPTFDLPAGANSLGGSCPGAQFSQSTLPYNAFDMEMEGENRGRLTTTAEIQYVIDGVQEDWKYMKLRDGESIPAPAINLKSTVCTYCYATGGKYGEATVQFAEVARYAFVKTLMNDEKGRKLLESLLVYVIENTLEWEDDTGATARHRIRPIRIHSSGDFYSPEYAKVWLAVARRIDANWKRDNAGKPEALQSPRVVLWAPTRTHVLEKHIKMWTQEKAAGNIPENFVIRPSAYSSGDPAPYIRRESPTGSKGTSVLFEDDAAKRIERVGPAEFGDGQYHLDTTRNPPLFIVDKPGTKFDWQCGVYALKAGNKTCMSAIAPDGKPGCRACWTQRNMTVNYVIH